MLKKVVINFFVTIELIMVLMIIFAGVANAAPVWRYVRAGYIEDVDREGGFTVLVTKDGNVWFWNGTSYRTKTGRKFLKTGSRVVAVIDGQGTPDVTDDQLVDFEIYER